VPAILREAMSIRTHLSRHLWRVVGIVVVLIVLVPVPAYSAEEIPVLTTPAGEFQPARGPSHLAWEQNTSGTPKHYDVMLQPDGKEAVKVNKNGTLAAMGGIDGSRLVYQQFRRGRSNLKFFDLEAMERGNPPPGVNKKRRFEYWPSISGPWLLYGGLSKNESRKLILLNLDSGERRVLDRTRTKKAFIGPGQVNGDFVVWSTCRRVCNVFRYQISAGTTEKVPNPGSYQRAPSVSPGGTVYFSRGGKGCGHGVSLVRYPIGGPEEILVQLQQVLDIRDTYVFRQSDGTIEVFYERNACGRPAASDIYRIVDTGPPGSITVRKETNPEGSTEEFGFDHDLGGIDFFLRDNAAKTFTDKQLGTYTVQEVLLPEDWALTAISCAGGGENTVWSVATRTATIGLDQGEAVVCTFTNTEDKGLIPPPPRLSGVR
jgi:hypothetical protein